MRPLLLSLVCAAAAAAQPAANTVNLLFLGDSLTEGVPHLNGEADTYPYMVAAAIPGSTYVKLGYRGQPTDYLLTHLDAFLFGLQKTEYQKNVLVVWAGTNDCALGPVECVEPAYVRLTLIARAARAAGWKVVAITTIARGAWFADDQHQRQFPASQTALNNRMRASSEFDAVADPAPLLDDSSNGALYWDRCHLLPPGYRIVAGEVLKAISTL